MAPSLPWVVPRPQSLALLGLSVSAFIAAVAVYVWSRRRTSRGESEPLIEDQDDPAMTSTDETAAVESNGAEEVPVPIKEKHRSPSGTSTSDSGHSWNDMVEEEEEDMKQQQQSTLDGSFLSSKLEKLTLNDSNTAAAVPKKGDSADKDIKDDDKAKKVAKDDMSTKQLSATSASSASKSQNSPSHDSGITSPTETGSSSTDMPLQGPDSGQGSESGDSSTDNSGARCEYQFLISNFYAGRLIGFHGKQIQNLKLSTNCNMVVTRSTPQNRYGKRSYNSHGSKKEMETCTIEGTKANIEKCLKMIRDYFPLSAFPDLNLERVNGTPEFGVSPAQLALNQPSPLLTFAQRHAQEVTVSSFRNAGHFFIQLPQHCTYPLLARLQECMDHTYSQTSTPAVPKDAPVGLICMAPYEEGWHRVQIVSNMGGESGQDFDIKYLDYGDLATTHRSQLRQIRDDLVQLPWQAIEVRLANVVPVNARTHGCEFGSETAEEMYEMLKGKHITSQLVGYGLDSLPLVNLYSREYIGEAAGDDGSTTSSLGEPVLVNRQLVDAGMAQWVEQQPIAVLEEEEQQQTTVAATAEVSSSWGWMDQRMEHGSAISAYHYY